MAHDDGKGSAEEPVSQDALIGRLRAVQAGFEVDVAGVGRMVTARHRRRTAVAVLASIVCVLAGGMVAVEAQQAARKTASAAAARCPATLPYPSAIASDPLPDFDSTSRLVPDITPTSAILCSYHDTRPSNDQAALPLTGSRAITSGLDRIPGDLDLAATPDFVAMSCPPPLVVNERRRAVLVLGYGSRYVRVTEGVQLGCTRGIVNDDALGSIRTVSSRDLFESSIEDSEWVGASSVNATCDENGPYRNPGGSALNIGEPASVRVCSSTGQDVLLDDDARAEVLKALRQAPRADLTRAPYCGSRTYQTLAFRYGLILGYTHGSPLAIHIQEPCEDLAASDVPNPTASGYYAPIAVPIVNSDALLRVVEANS